MIIVNGTIDVDPDQRDAFIEAARALMADTRAEAGCEGYAFAADLDDPGRFHVTENWADDDAVAGHMASPHMATFFGAVGGAVKGASLMKYTGATAEKLM